MNWKENVGGQGQLQCPYVRPSGGYSVRCCVLRHGHLWANIPHEDVWETRGGPWVRSSEISWNAEELTVWRGRLLGEMEER